MRTMTFVGTVALALGAALAAAMGAQAQQVYRIVGPDGKVTFSDQPPPSSSNNKVTAGKAGASMEGRAEGFGMPFELRTAVQRYPVTLYAAANCGTCDTGRAMLRSRGIPFSERLVTNDADEKALRNLTGATSLPVLTVGSQQLKGYSDGEWSQYLDLAGYPKTSVLPSNYRYPAATPMVAKAAEPKPAASAAAPAAPAAPGPAPSGAAENPAGIKF